MSKKRNDDRKKKKRQERIRQEKQKKEHAQKSAQNQQVWAEAAQATVADLRRIKDSEFTSYDSYDERTFAHERVLRAQALESGQWVVDAKMIAHAHKICLQTDHFTWIGDSETGPAREQAQELAYSALESDYPTDTMIDATAALKLDPNCLDAQLALYLVQKPADRVQQLPQLHALAQKALDACDPTLFAQHRENGFCILPARPYFRIQDAIFREYLTGKHYNLAIALIEPFLALDYEFGCESVGELLNSLISARESSKFAALLNALPSDHEMTLLMRGILEFREGHVVQAKHIILQAYQKSVHLAPVLENKLDDAKDDLDNNEDRAIEVQRMIALTDALRSLMDVSTGFNDWIQRSMPVMTAADIKNHLATYAMPVAALLSMKDPDLHVDNPPNYQEKYGINAQHRQELERLLSDQFFNQELSPGHPARWAPSHAWLALIQIHDPHSIPELIAYLCRDIDEFAFDRLPEALGTFGAAAIPAVVAALQHDYDRDEFISSALLRALSSIAQLHTNTRAEIIALLENIVQGRQPLRKMTRASASFQLAELGSTQSLSVIKKAYDDGVVDEGYCSLKNIEKRLQKK
jgi:Protein of unknown function (DUF1186)